jgi:hypothetical protein
MREPYDKQNIQITNIFHTRAGILIRWSCKGVGFGELYVQEKDGQLHFETECMGRQFVKDVMCAAIDAGTTDNND